MKNKVLILSAIAILGAVMVKVKSLGQASLKIETKRSAPLLVKASVTSSNSLKVKSPLKVEIQKDKITEEYQGAANALAMKIEKLGLDGNELSELFNRVGKENFLKHVPKEIRADYLNLEEKVAAMQLAHLAKDGMTPSFFTKYEVEMPEWIKNQREEVELSKLPSAVTELVMKTMSEPEIENEYINKILVECGKGNAPCINKAFAMLIDANHGLSDNQLKLIQEYL
ncbi:MAG TPA: hypothetical protein VNJ08_09540 [Bacteriovoracaceae bacterium]|nr:hypothetical protein [Bacteriovoracaceae bacterium]